VLQTERVLRVSKSRSLFDIKEGYGKLFFFFKDLLSVAGADIFFFLKFYTVLLTSSFLDFLEFLLNLRFLNS
jgi:hypothetical protein